MIVLRVHGTAPVHVFPHSIGLVDFSHQTDVEEKQQNQGDKVPDHSPSGSVGVVKAVILKQYVRMHSQALASVARLPNRVPPEHR